MRLQPSLILAFIVISLCCCRGRTDTRYPYAIRDFRAALRPHLTRILETGIVMNGDAGLHRLATEAELYRLSLSEHPILRAAALHELLGRHQYAPLQLINNHLDDTALVFTDWGEFGIFDRTVSDYILEVARWKNEQEKASTLFEVMTRHNYLRSAYTILTRLKPDPRFYPYIREMAMRPRRIDTLQGYELGFPDTEYALYGLARFRKKEDVGPIRDRLLKHAGEMSELSFRLMKEFPDSAYFIVLEQYHHQFYRFSGYRPHGFTGYPADRAAPEDFIDALAAQQSERSARLLDTVYQRVRNYKCMPDQGGILQHLAEAIWNNPCPAYTVLRNKVRARILASQQHSMIIDDVSVIPVVDTNSIVRW